MAQPDSHCDKRRRTDRGPRRSGVDRSQREAGRQAERIGAGVAPDVLLLLIGGLLMAALFFKLYT
jgi:hypothetical protein